MISIHEQIPAIPWVAQENKRFIEILRGLDVQSWKRPTYCTGWFVADVVAHMTLGARFYAHVIPAGKEGRLEMPFGAVDLETFWAILILPLIMTIVIVPWSHGNCQYKICR